MLQIEGQLSAQFATTENADTSCDEQHTTKAPMQAGSQFSCETQATIEHISPSHPVIDHDDRDMCNVRHKQPSIQIGERMMVQKLTPQPFCFLQEETARTISGSTHQSDTK